MSRSPFLAGVPFQAIDWDSVPQTAHRGASGTALMRVVERGGLRLRRIEYSAGYRGDHWCRLGHVGLVLEGELDLEIRGGPTSRLSLGASFVVGTDTDDHLAASKDGATLFVVD